MNIFSIFGDSQTNKHLSTIINTLYMDVTTVST